MLFKFIGGMFVVISSYMIGCLKSYEYQDRAKYLLSLHNCITKLENEIRYTQTPISVAFKNISHSAHPIVKKIFVSVSLASEELSGKLLNTIWHENVMNNSDELFSDDIELLLQFENCLVSSDVEGQIKSIAQYKEMIKTAMHYAENYSQNNKKMFRSTGLYLGILLAILFI